jgi:hypothetical protein
LYCLNIYKNVGVCLFYLDNEMFFFTWLCNWILSFYQEYVYISVEKPKRIYYKDQYAKFPDVINNHKAILIILHGANTKTSQCINHVNLYENHNKNNPNQQYAFFIPPIKELGILPIKDCIDDLIEKIPNKTFEIPIFIIGISNGGRLALTLSTKIRSSKSIFISTIGSPLNGTLIANFFLKTNLYKCIKNNPEFFKELSQNSDVSQNIVSEYINSDPNYKNKIICYASNNDLYVYPGGRNSIILDAPHKIINGYGHKSLIIQCISDQYRWIESKTLIHESTSSTRNSIF